MCWTFLQEYWTKNIDSFKEDFHERGSFRAHRSWRDGHGRTGQKRCFPPCQTPVCALPSPPAKRTKPSCSRSPARRMCAFLPTVAEMYASGLIDAVLIATPHRLHVQQAVEAFRAGVHVLLEKPMGVSTQEVRLLNAGSGPRVAGRSAPCSISAPTPLIGK